MNYFNCVEQDCFVYSIDMVRFQSYVQDVDVIDSLRFFLDVNSGFHYFPGRGYGHFIDNYSGPHFWLGLGSFGSKKDGLNVTIEFNPNKCDESDFTFFIFLFRLIPDFRLIRFDLAIDIPFKITDLFFGSLLKKSYSVFFKSYEDITYYFGKGDGHTKIYNKTIESNLDFDLTRYEVTKECSIALDTSSAIEPIKFNFVELTLMPYFKFGDVFDDVETFNAVLYAVNHGFPYKSLSRHYKEVIKKEYTGLYFLSEEVANNCLRSFLCKFKSRNI